MSFRSRLYENYRSQHVRADESVRIDEFGQKSRWRASMVATLAPSLRGLNRSARIVDLGCGSGEIITLLRAQGFYRVSGIDVSPEQVVAAQQAGLDVQEADLLPYLARHHAELDGIFAINLAEHLSKSELLDFVESAHGALVPGGRLVMTTPNAQGLFPNQVMYGDLTHMVALTPGSMAQLLRFGGFSEMSFHETPPQPVSWRGSVRRILWEVIRFGATGLRVVETGKRQHVWTENFVTVAFRSSNDSISPSGASAASS